MNKWYPVRTRLANAIAMALLAGCAPARESVRVEVKRVFVPVPAELTNEHPIEPSGTLAECPAVAAKRAKEIEECNADKAETRALEGTPVPRGYKTE